MDRAALLIALGASVLFAGLGFVMRIMHWPFASALLWSGITGAFVSAVLLLFKERQNRGQD